MSRLSFFPRAGGVKNDASQGRAGGGAATKLCMRADGASGASSPPGPPPPELDSQQDCCPICLDPLESDISTTVCRHRFHRACLAQWTQVRPACPLCQENLQPAAVPRARHRRRLRRRRRRACARWWGCARALCGMACWASVVFYAVLYAGKAALWCLSEDHHHNHTIAIIVNATRVNATRVNATRARHIDWSPASIHFGYIFMGGVVFDVRRGLSLCCTCCCRG